MNPKLAQNSYIYIYSKYSASKKIPPFLDKKDNFIR